MPQQRSNAIAAHNLNVRLRNIAGLFESIRESYDFDERLASLSNIGLKHTLSGLQDVCTAFDLPATARPRRPKLEIVQ